MLIAIVTGTRPNLIKAAPLIREFKKQKMPFHFIHTFQHYDDSMFKDIIKDLEMPDPDYIFRSSKGDRTIIRMTNIMTDFEWYCINMKPDLVLVFGDVDSTLAIALVANKLKIPLGHIEAGERSGNRSMPEEINRIIIDVLSDYHFCASQRAFNRLPNGYFVGNLMMDQLKYTLEKKDSVAITSEPYGILTLHRQFLVDHPDRFKQAMELIADATEKVIVHFPIHPRTFNKHFTKESKSYRNIIFHEPWLYTDFIMSLKDSEFIITDSGGVQNEASYLNIPTITLRNQTEWHDTIHYGSNCLFREGMEIAVLKNWIDDILDGKWIQSKFKDLPENKTNAAENIVKIIQGLNIAKIVKGLKL